MKEEKASIEQSCFLCFAEAMIEVADRLNKANIEQLCEIRDRILDHPSGLDGIDKTSVLILRAIIRDRKKNQ